MTRSNIRPYNINLDMEARGYKPNSICPNKDIGGQCNQKLQASGMKFVVCCNGHRYNRWSAATEEEKEIVYQKWNNKKCKTNGCDGIMTYGSSCKCGYGRHKLLKCNNDHKWYLDDNLEFVSKHTS